MADKTQTHAAPTTPENYILRPPEGKAIAPALDAKWKAAFKDAGLTQGHAETIVDWYFRLQHDAEAYQREQALMQPHEVAALTQRQKELTAKRHSRTGLNAREFAELLETNQRLMMAYERQDGEDAT